MGSVRAWCGVTYTEGRGGVSGVCMVCVHLVCMLCACVWGVEGVHDGTMCIFCSKHTRFFTNQQTKCGGHKPVCCDRRVCKQMDSSVQHSNVQQEEEQFVWGRIHECNTGGCGRKCSVRDLVGAKTRVLQASMTDMARHKDDEYNVNDCILQHKSTSVKRIPPWICMLTNKTAPLYTKRSAPLYTRITAPLYTRTTSAASHAPNHHHHPVPQSSHQPSQCLVCSCVVGGHEVWHVWW